MRHEGRLHFSGEIPNGITSLNLKVCHPRFVDIKHNVVIRTVNKHNNMWYITNVSNNKLILATNVITLTTATTCFGLQGQHQVELGS
jgi:hypothetical protein